MMPTVSPTLIAPGGLQLVESRCGHSLVPPSVERRAATRLAVALTLRLTWKDRNGATRFATVVARDVSDFGMFVECRMPVPLSLFRLVYVQPEVADRRATGLPAALAHGPALAAVYRVQPADVRGRSQGLALRLMIEPSRVTSPRPSHASA